jgi:hypothetical protein
VQSAHASDGGSWDGFLAKLSASGSSLVYSTYLGGSLEDQISRVALDPAGNAYWSAAPAPPISRLPRRFKARTGPTAAPGTGS